MRPLLDEPHLPAIITRAQGLEPDAPPRWGGLTVSGMLYHCTLVHEQILAARTTRPPTVKERLLKLVLLTMTRLPRGVRTGPALLAPAPDQLNFEQERAAFLAAATRFAQHPGPLLAAHPFLGLLNAREWRRFAWLHLDHHLRQFGV